MHEVNISPPLSLAKFFLIQQLIYNKGKIGNCIVSLDIFVSDTSQKPSSAWRNNI